MMMERKKERKMEMKSDTVPLVINNSVIVAVVVVDIDININLTLNELDSYILF